ncbi:hypothetical protein LPJ61_005267, partial [Coemansia biformis]
MVNRPASASNANVLPEMNRRRESASAVLVDREGDLVISSTAAVPVIDAVAAIQNVPKWQATTEAAFG